MHREGIAIVDYGIGNLRSVERAFAAVGVEAVVSSEERVLLAADALVLPGVGAFKSCMKELSSRGFDDLVRNRAADGVPLLGVCVGMQMLFTESEEFGRSDGLGLLPGHVRRFPDDVRIPQVGWNQVRLRTPHPLLENIDKDSFFYFVHSFYCDPAETSVVIGETCYSTTYASIVVEETICGVQFHPEKSQQPGLQLLSNFANWVRG